MSEISETSEPDEPPFALYNYEQFPEVRVTFHGTIKKENDFTWFTQQWIDLYVDQREFNFLFDMKDIGLVNPLYSYKMASFISELKKHPVQYLTHSKKLDLHSNNDLELQKNQTQDEILHNLFLHVQSFQHFQHQYHFLAQYEPAQLQYSLKNFKINFRFNK